MKDFLNKGIPMPKIILGARGCGKTLLAQKELEDYQKEHPDEPIIIAKPLSLNQSSQLKGGKFPIFPDKIIIKKEQEK